MSMSEVEEHLRRETGLHVDALGNDAVRRAVERRLATHPCSGVQEYARRLVSDSEEARRLVEEVVVPETWLFREPDTLRHVAIYIRDQWAPQHPDRVARILSLPCATGEEPYSLAMALLEEGVQTNQFQIDGIDIHPGFVRKAHTARYGKSSFRACDPAYQHVHFDPVGDAFQLKDEIRKSVHLYPGNLFDPDLPRLHARYDVVICRNLLIYFDEDARVRATAVFESLLTEDGKLALAAAESLPATVDGFRRSAAPFGHIYRRVSDPATGPVTPVSTGHGKSGSRLPTAHSTFGRGIDRAVHLADDGHIREAIGVCEALLRDDEMNPDVHCLIGILEAARGHDERAEHVLRRALYLDPQHSDALTHLSIQLQRQGRTSEANRLRGRAARSASMARVEEPS